MWLGPRAAGIICVTLAFACHALPASSATVIYVDVSGTDSISCGASNAACKTLQGGVNRAGEGDTVYLIVPGNYGPATVDRSMTIQAVRGAGVYNPSGTPCVTVDGTSTTHVIIRELICDTGTTGQHGIVFKEGKFLTVDWSYVYGGNSGSGKCGLLIQSTTPGASFRVERSDIVWFFGAANAGGICVVPPANHHVYGYVLTSRIEGNSNGLLSNATAAGSSIDILVEATWLNSNTTGVSSIDASSVVALRGSTVYRNTVGLKRTTGGQIVSYRGNMVYRNTTNGTFSDSGTPE